MNLYRKTASIVGILFIIGTVSGILSALITGSIFDDPNYLTEISAHQTRVVLGAVCVLTMGFALAMVPVMMFPIFKKQNEALALGSVVFRGALEAVSYIAMVLSWLFLIVLSQEFVNAATPIGSHFQDIGTLLLAADEQINPILQIVFSLGTLMFYYLFFQTNLIPRWLSGWGLIGGILYFAYGLLAMFGANIEILYAPLALQEMIMAIWLIVKGFDPSAVASLSAK